MKHFSKVIGIALLLFLFAACQEGSMDVAKVRGNKHSNERILADLIITTPTTLSSSASYGLIEIQNGGNLTITSGATITCENFKSSVNHIYATFVDIQQGATFNITGLYPQVSINPITTIHVRGNFTHSSWLDLFGYVTVYSTGKHISPANVQIYQGKYTINGGETILGDPQHTGHMWMRGTGILNFENCGKLTTETLAVDAGSANRIEGTGRIRAKSAILNDVMTASSKIIICADNYYYPYGGSTGAANTSCLKMCFEL